VVQVMNDRFPRMVEFVAIFAIEVIQMFFNFKGFSNDMGGVIRGKG
jgi:hypothetical protein